MYRDALNSPPSTVFSAVLFQFNVELSLCYKKSPVKQHVVTYQPEALLWHQVSNFGIDDEEDQSDAVTNGDVSQVDQSGSSFFNFLRRKHESSSLVIFEQYVWSHVGIHLNGMVSSTSPLPPLSNLNRC